MIRPDPSDDLTAQFRAAFEQRAYQTSDAARYEQEQETLDADASRQKNDQAGRDFIQGLGLGDTLPSLEDYDYGKMLADGVHPRPDEQGRLPLPPRYFRAGKLVIDGVDLATGQRITSRVSLEDRILANTLDDDGEPDDPHALLMTALDDPSSELTPSERASLMAWRKQRASLNPPSMMPDQPVRVADALGSSDTRTDAQSPLGPLWPQQADPFETPKHPIIETLMGPKTEQPLKEQIFGQRGLHALGGAVTALSGILDQAGFTFEAFDTKFNPTLNDVTLGHLGKVLQDISKGDYPVDKNTGIPTLESLELLGLFPLAGGVKLTGKALIESLKTLTDAVKKSPEITATIAALGGAPDEAEAGLAPSISKFLVSAFAKTPDATAAQIYKGMTEAAGRLDKRGHDKLKLAAGRAVKIQAEIKRNGWDANTVLWEGGLGRVRVGSMEFQGAHIALEHRGDLTDILVASGRAQQEVEHMPNFELLRGALDALEAIPPKNGVRYIGNRPVKIVKSGQYIGTLYLEGGR